MKIGLCMIVKNESHIIHESLGCTLPLIDTYCIVDTGSTDNTIQKIKDFYESKGIQGVVHERPWKNFGHNRSEALQLCDGKMDYALVIDADDLMEFPKNAKDTIQEILNKYKPNCCDILIKQESIEYWRGQIFKCNDNWGYVGVLHEYPSNKKENNVKIQLPRDFFMISRRLGGRNLTGDKLKRDIEVLTQGLVDEPDNDRYVFYLAQSYKDSGDAVNGIKYYKKRFHMGRWMEEAWFSAYQVGMLYKRLNNIHKFEYWMQKAHDMRPWRAEPMYHLTEHFRVNGKLHKAYEYCKIGSQIKYPDQDVLFVEKFPHRGGFAYEKTILDYYVHDDKKIGLRDCFNYLLNNGENAYNVLSNLKFYASAIPSRVKKLEFQNPFGSDFRPSAVSVLNYPFVNSRFVNYQIQPDGSYKTPNGRVVTRNAYINLETGESIAMEDPVPLFDSEVAGIEDLRIYEEDGKVLFTSTSYKQYLKDQISIVAGTYNRETMKLEDARGIYSPTGNSCEKNWVHVPGTSDIIYSWSPLRIGQLKDNQLVITKTIDTKPLFSYFRGSSPPIEWNGEWLVLVHFVEYCTPRKYYHCFVRLTKDYQPLGVSLPFFFRQNAIEYCIAVTNKNNAIQCYASLNDCDPHEIEFQYSSLEWITDGFYKEVTPSELPMPNSKSTIVSMFFNLKKLPDATNEVRPPEFYIENGKKTLELPYPMVLFCDDETRPILEKLRGDKPTQYIEKNIMEYDYFKELYPKVVENRKSIPSPDPRNTSSYFLNSLFKFKALEIAKQTNYFSDTTHYFWIDLGGSHVMRGFPDAVYKMLNNPRPKISCGYIHYRPDSELYPMKEFMRYGGKCCIGSGAFSVEVDYIERYVSHIFEILREQVSLGVGHAEEQCMVYSYSKHPEWFNIYFADYYSLVTNYHKTVEDIDGVKRHFIENAAKSGRTDLVKMALDSIK